LTVYQDRRIYYGGFFGVVSKDDCVHDLYFGTDYHSHLGTKRGGMAVLGKHGFKRSIHDISNTQFRSKFDGDLPKFKGRKGIGSSAISRTSR